MNRVPRSIASHFGRRTVVMVLAFAHAWARFGAGGEAVTWHGVELAWRNDPRPAADDSLPVEPPPSRRGGRRAQRRSFRRVEFPPTPAESIPAETVASPPADGDATVTADATAVHRDQAYGDHVRQRYDVHLPDGCSAGGLPLVVWIHGPDWRTGSKAACPVDWLVGQGFAVASIEYRPTDEVAFPGQLDDCRAALEAIRADAETWGIDPRRICVAGDGGGGHLAALVAYAADDPPAAQVPDAAPHEPCHPAAVAAFDAPTHLPSLGGHHDRAGSAASRLVGGPLPEFREVAQRASPVVHVSADAPPTLIVHSADGGVPVEQGRLLDAALEAAGVDAELVVLDVPATELVPVHESPAGNALLEFLDRTLGPGPTTHEN
ncbi:MAG: alpha/beta hydrolase [Planctomycetes bacterium]|nr:alpha/beta hydrolase [Planctomycetota bacterium]